MPIDHIIVLMLENASFDRMLGGLQSVLPGLEGIDTSNLSPYRNDGPGGAAYLPQPTRAPNVLHDPGHDVDDVAAQLADGNRGFVTDYDRLTHGILTPTALAEVMGYYPAGALPVLHALARNYAICDHWYASLGGPTWPNRFYVHSGTCKGIARMPTLFDPELHWYDQKTIYGLLSERGVSWRIFFGDFPQSLLLTELWDKPDQIKPMADFHTLASGPADAFPAYSFIEPRYFGSAPDDQHPPHDVARGEALIAEVYNAIRDNAALWESSLLVILYDEHGGFYDHIAPPALLPPAMNPEETTPPFQRLGVRVPALLVSPWVDRRIIQTPLEHASLLQFVIGKWGLGRLTNRVAAAESFADVFRASPRPAADCPRGLAAATPGPLIASRPANHNQTALLQFSQYLEAKHMPATAPTVMAARQARSFEGPDAQAQVVSERARQFLAGAAPVMTA